MQIAVALDTDACVFPTKMASTQFFFLMFGLLMIELHLDTFLKDETRFRKLLIAIGGSMIFSMITIIAP